MLLADVPKDDLYQLFSNTFQFHKKLGWRYITDVEGSLCTITSCDGLGKSTLCRLTDAEWEIRAPSLGFVNHEGGVVYLSRLPKRIMKAGVSFDAIAMDVVENAKMVDLSHLIHMVRRLQCNLEMAFNNLYPSLQMAIAMVRSTATAVAYDRQFAVHYSGKISYRGRTAVGVCDFATGQITYSPRYRHLEFAGVDYGKNLQAAKQAARQRIGRVGD